MKINGEKLKAKMKEKGLTQEELAEKINVNRAIISYWINGKRGAKNTVILSMANALGVDAEYLTDGKKVPYDDAMIAKGTLAIFLNNDICPGGDCGKCPFFNKENCYAELKQGYVDFLKRKGIDNVDFVK